MTREQPAMYKCPLCHRLDSEEVGELCPSCSASERNIGEEWGDETEEWYALRSSV